MELRAKSLRLAVTALAVVGLALFGGCMSPAARLDVTGPRCDLHLTAVCVTLLSGGQGKQFEASLASHPSDAGRLVVTWTEREDRAARIWAATTTDGGATWTSHRLQDPTVSSKIGKPLYAFDPIAAYAPDGAALVLYGGDDDETSEQDAYVPVTDRITLARTDDSGRSWSYHRVSDLPAPWSSDFMDLAVAPDTGHLFVVAQVFAVSPGYASPNSPVYYVGSFQPIGLWMFRSTDGGQTWSDPASFALPARDGNTYYAPRVAAGPGGRVVVTAYAYDGTYPLPTNAYAGPFAFVSADDGATFTASRIASPEYGVTHGKPVLGGREDPGSIAVILTKPKQDTGLHVARSSGGKWAAPQLLATLPEEPEWAVTAGDASLTVLSSWTNACDKPATLRWGMSLTRAAPSLSSTLVGPLDDAPTNCRPSNDYGGVVVAADGAVWAAWSQPVDGHPVIAVGRIVR